ncbi:hypothetical protein ABIB82_006679 [Bradyrhizobium sp. i1.8.4]
MALIVGRYAFSAGRPMIDGGRDARSTLSAKASHDFGLDCGCGVERNLQRKVPECKLAKQVVGTCFLHLIKKKLSDGSRRSDDAQFALKRCIEAQRQGRRCRNGIQLVKEFKALQPSSLSSFGGRMSVLVRLRNHDHANQPKKRLSPVRGCIVRSMGAERIRNISDNTGVAYASQIGTICSGPMCRLGPITRDPGWRIWTLMRPQS